MGIADAMADEQPLASLSLTHVHYAPNDPVSYVCAWLALVPQALCLTYVVLFWATREAEIGLMFAGQMACEAANFALKRLIKEERPHRMGGKGYGMPSSHAQFVAFFAVYLTLFLLLRQRPLHLESPSRPAPPIPLPAPRVQHALIAMLFLVAAAAVAASRIYLSYHTPRQVLAGCAAGAGFGIVWFLVTDAVRQMGWLDWALHLPLVQMLRVRDLVIQEDLPEAGWRRWQDQQRSVAGSSRKKR